MKKLKFIVIICVMFNFSTEIIAQKGENPYEKTVEAYTQYFNEKFGIIVKPLEELINLNQFYVFWLAKNDAVKYGGAAGMYGPIFMSKNEDCIIAFDALPNYKSEFEKERLGITPLYFPVSQIISEIETNLGIFEFVKKRTTIKDAKFEFNEYVTTITGKKPRTMFNADSIFVYDFPKGDSVFFTDNPLEKKRKDKYPYCTGIFITKKDRATMGLKLFFTKASFKKKDKYIEMLSHEIWYRDDFQH